MVNSLFPPSGGGGAERSVAELATGLAAHGVEVEVVTLWDGESEQRSEIEPGISVRRWRPPGVWPFGERPRSRIQRVRWHLTENYRHSARRFVRKAIREFGPDVVHTNNIAGFGVAILREIDAVRWVHTARDYYLLCPKTTLFRSGSRCTTRCTSCKALTSIRRLPRASPAEVVGVSERVVEIHQQAGMFTDRRWNVVPNTPRRISVARRQVREILTIGYLGRLNQAKGLGVLYDVFSRVEMQSLNLVVSGPVGDDVRIDAAMLFALPNVTYLGIAGPETLFSKVDLLMVPSQWEEPFGRVVQEAGSIGMPLLISARGGLVDAARGMHRVEVVKASEQGGAWVAALESVRSRWTDFWIGGVDHVSASATEAYLGLYQRVMDEAAQTTKRTVFPLLRDDGQQ